MASPQLEQGFIRLAHELDAALSAAGFGREENLILREVRAQCYGRNNRDVAVFNLSELERETGIPRQCFTRALRRLIECGVLVKTDAGHRFIKDYESWTRGGQPLFTSKLVAYCQSATRRSCTTTKGKRGSASASPPEAPALQSDNKGEAPALQVSEAPALHELKRQRFTPDPSAHRNARAELETFETREEIHTNAGTGTHDSSYPIAFFRKIEAWVIEHYGTGEELNAEHIAKFAVDQLRAGHPDYSIEAALVKAWNRQQPIPVKGLTRWIETVLVNSPKVVIPAAPLTANPSTPVPSQLTAREQRRKEFREKALTYWKKPEEPLG